MNRFMRVLLSLMLGVVLLTGSALAAASVRFEGGAEKFVFLPGSSYSKSDMFENFKDVLPGDMRTQEITVKNATDKQVRIYMYAEPVSAADKDFLSQMKLKVEARNKTIFDAAADETAGLTDKILLGTFKRNGSTELAVTLTVPADLGNEYMNRQGTVPWTFLAEEVDIDTTADTGDWFDMGIWLGAAAVLLALILVLALRNRRKEA